MQMEKDKPKFRSSGIGHLMTEPKLVADKSAGNLSEGAKGHVIDVFTQWKYHRREDIYSKYIEKGNELEEDAITLVSVLTGIFHKKNEKNKNKKNNRTTEQKEQQNS
jgi:predicted nucleotide-binding protein (sugar kinase/HSP70/actin superfamily)